MARTPDPLTFPWRGGSIRVRHDDPALRPYSPRASVILAASTLASTPDGLRRILEATVGEHYRDWSKVDRVRSAGTQFENVAPDDFRAVLPLGEPTSTTDAIARSHN